MRFELNVGDYISVFGNPAIGESVVFGAFGSVYASAIKRTSKSRYKVYVIGSFWGCKWYFMLWHK